VGNSAVMTGVDGGAGPGARTGRRWDVALSFAGAQRDYVGQVADALKARGVCCFYDADKQVRLWGTHLAEELPRIYARETAAVVVFISADYAGRDWTRLERRAALARRFAALPSQQFLISSRSSSWQSSSHRRGGIAALATRPSPAPGKEPPTDFPCFSNPSNFHCYSVVTARLIR